MSTTVSTFSPANPANPARTSNVGDGANGGKPSVEQPGASSVPADAGTRAAGTAEPTTGSSRAGGRASKRANGAASQRPSNFRTPAAPQRASTAMGVPATVSAGSYEDDGAAATVSGNDPVVVRSAFGRVMTSTHTATTVRTAAEAKSPNTPGAAAPLVTPPTPPLTATAAATPVTSATAVSLLAAIAAPTVASSGATAPASQATMAPTSKPDDGGSAMQLLAQALNSGFAAGGASFAMAPAATTVTKAVATDPALGTGGSGSGNDNGNGNGNGDLGVGANFGNSNGLTDSVKGNNDGGAANTASLLGFTPTELAGEILASTARGALDNDSHPNAATVDTSAIASALTAQQMAAPAHTTTAPAPIPSMQLQAPIGSAQWQQQLGGQLLWMAHSGTSSASLQMSPPNLGPVEVRVAVHAGQTSILFGATHASTRDALEQALPRLRDMFSSSGLSLADASVFREPPRQQSPGTTPTASRSIAAEVTAPTPPVASLVARLGLVDTYA